MLVLICVLLATCFATFNDFSPPDVEDSAEYAADYKIHHVPHALPPPSIVPPVPVWFTITRYHATSLPEFPVPSPTVFSTRGPPTIIA